MVITLNKTTSLDISKVVYYYDTEGTSVEYEQENIKEIVVGEEYKTNSALVENFFYYPDDFPGIWTVGENTGRVEKISLANYVYFVMKVPGGVQRIDFFSRLSLGGNYQLVVCLDLTNNTEALTSDGVSSASSDNTSRLLGSNAWTHDRVLCLSFVNQDMEPSGVEDISLVEVHKAFGHQLHRYNPVLYTVDHKQTLTRQIWDLITSTYDLEFSGGCLHGDNLCHYYVGSRVSLPVEKSLAVHQYDYLYTSEDYLTSHDNVTGMPTEAELLTWLKSKAGTPANGTTIVVNLGQEEFVGYYVYESGSDSVMALDVANASYLSVTVNGVEYRLATDTSSSSYKYPLPTKGWLYTYTSPVRNSSGYIRYYYLKNYAVDSEIALKPNSDSNTNSRLETNNPDSNNYVGSYTVDKFPTKLTSSGETKDTTAYPEYLIRQEYPISGTAEHMIPSTASSVHSTATTSGNRSRALVMVTLAGQAGDEEMDLTVSNQNFTTYGDKILYPSMVKNVFSK